PGVPLAPGIGIGMLVPMAPGIGIDDGIGMAIDVGVSSGSGMLMPMPGRAVGVGAGVLVGVGTGVAVGPATIADSGLLEPANAQIPTTNRMASPIMAKPAMAPRLGPPRPDGCAPGGPGTPRAPGGGWWTGAPQR